MKTTLLVSLWLMLLCGCASSGSSSPGPNVKIYRDSSPAQSAAAVPVAAVAPADAATRQNYVQKHPDLTGEIKQAILAGKAVTGMTDEQVQLVWGSPATVQRMLGISGPREEWTYSDGRHVSLQLGMVYDLK